MKKAYVLCERDDGGTFSSHFIPMAVTFDKQKAKDWVAEYPNERTYEQVKVL